MLKKLLFLIKIILVLAPFVLMAYHLRHWVKVGEIELIPLTHALYYWFGIDMTISHVSPSFAGLYKLYIYIVRLPLIFWLSIIAVVAAIDLYKEME